MSRRWDAKATGLIHTYHAEVRFYQRWPFIHSFPLAVNRYRWRRLRGLSGMVISRSPSPISGFRYLFRNFVLFVQDSAAMRSVIPWGVWQRLNIFRRSSSFNPNLVPTWSRLSPDLVPNSLCSARSSFVMRWGAFGWIGNLATRQVRFFSILIGRRVSDMVLISQYVAHQILPQRNSRCLLHIFAMIICFSVYDIYYEYNLLSRVKVFDDDIVIVFCTFLGQAMHLRHHTIFRNGVHLTLLSLCRRISEMTCWRTWKDAWSGRKRYHLSNRIQWAGPRIKSNDLYLLSRGMILTIWEWCRTVVHLVFLWSQEWCKLPWDAGVKWEERICVSPDAREHDL